MKTPFKTAYGENPRVKQHTGGETMTQQHMAESCDINWIMKRYEKDGIIEHYNQHQGDYSDYSEFPDFHTAMNKVIDAQDMFMTLPAGVRDKFNNDPGAFVEFVSDDNNFDAMVEMGLAKPGDEIVKKPAEKKPEKPAEKKPDEAPKAETEQSSS